MKIFVNVKTNAKQVSVKKIDETHFYISVKEPARERKANAAVRRVLADYFFLPLSSVALVRGGASKQKIFEMLL